MKPFIKILGFLGILLLLVLCGLAFYYLFSPKETFKNSYYTKIWQTGSGSDVLFPEKCLNRFNKPSTCGLAYSGGGARSYSAIIGYLRGLKGLHNNVDYISTSSAGSWFNGVYSFATSKGISSSELLGESIQLSTMDLDALYNKNGNNTFMGARINDDNITNREIINALSLKVPINDIWNYVIGKLFLEPYGLNKDVPATLNNKFAEDINNINGTNLDILRLKDTDPFWICNATLFYEFNNDPFSIINFTPMYSGVIKTYLIRNELNLGGYVIENYAFGCNLQTNSKLDYVDYSSLVDKYGAFCKNNPFFRTVDNPKSKCFTLRDMMGLSSSKYVANITLFKLLSFLGSDYNIWYKNLKPPTTKDSQCGGLNLNTSCNVDENYASDSCTPYLDKCYTTNSEQCKADGDCSFNFLNGCTNNKGGSSLNCRMGFFKCTCNKNNSPSYNTSEYKSKSLKIGDSGSLDDLGIISLVSRGVNKIVCFVNTQDSKARIANLFGVKEKNNLSSVIEGLKIFDTNFYNTVLSDFDSCRASNGPVYSRQKLNVLKNDLFGVKGGYEVDIMFLILQPCLKFINLLPLSLKNLINTFPNSDFIYSSKFTTGLMDETSRFYGILYLSKTQINLISTYTDWCINQPEISRHVNELLSQSVPNITEPPVNVPQPTVPNGKYKNYTDIPGTLVIKPCPVGNYCINGTKIPVPAGNYANEEGQSAPKKCPIGKYQNDVGQADCKTCPNGTYTDTEGSFETKKCPIGSFCVSGIKNIVPKGNYQDTEGASDYKKCPVGTYSDKEGSSQCSIPPPGYYQDQAGQSISKICEPGNYCINGIKKPCAIGTYASKEGSSECSVPPPGYYQDQPGQSTSKICDIANYCINGIKTPCSAGTYGPDEGLSKCLVPSPGYYQDQPGQSSSKICESGNYCRNGFKQPCPMGTSYTKTGGTTCYPDGFYNNRVTNTLTKCDTGYYCINGENIKVPAGTYTNDMGMSVPIPCPKGQYQNEIGKDRCKDAPIGSFVGTERSVSPTPCDIGQYQNEMGKSSCKPCQEGTYQDEIGKDRCKEAPVGSAVDKKGQSGVISCLGPVYQPKTGQDKCIDVPSGYYGDGSGSNIIFCPVGNYCTGGYKYPAPAGSYVDQPGQSTAIKCPSGKFSEKGASECSKTLTIILTTSNDSYSGTYSPVNVIVKNPKGEKILTWTLPNINQVTKKYFFQRGSKNETFSYVVMDPKTITLNNIESGYVYLELNGGYDWKLESAQLYYDDKLIRNYSNINVWLGNGTASFKGINFTNPTKATPYK